MRPFLSTLPLVVALTLALGACSSPWNSGDGRGAAPSTAGARDRAAEDSSRYPSTNEALLETARKLVAGASKGQAQVQRVFSGFGGMVGVVVSPTQGNTEQEGLVWMSPDGKALFPGPVLNAAGQNINEALAREQNLRGAPKAPPTDKAPLLTRAAEAGAGGFVQGTRGPVVTAIVDLNCPHCNTFFTNTQPLVKAGKLRVRYVLAGFLTPTSIPRAAAVLGAADKVAALRQAEVDFAKDHGQGPAPTFKPAHEATVKANTQLLMDTGQPSTPYLLYCDKATKAVAGAPGAPPQLDAFVAGLAEGPHEACSR